MFAVCSLKNIALINTDLDAPKISRSHIVFAYNSLYVPRGKGGGKKPCTLVQMPAKEEHWSLL